MHKKKNQEDKKKKKKKKRPMWRIPPHRLPRSTCSNLQSSRLLPLWHPMCQLPTTAPRIERDVPVFQSPQFPWPATKAAEGTGQTTPTQIMTGLSAQIDMTR